MRWRPLADPQRWVNVHAAWTELLRAETDDPLDRRLVECTADLTETVFLRPEGINAALQRFGATLGADGWHLQHVSKWLEMLVRVMPMNRRGVLTGYERATALADGWAASYVRGAQASESIDASTGLATPMVLQIRLAEIFDQCAALGHTPAEHYTFVVADADLEGLTVFERDAVMAGLASTASEVFACGEVIARHGGRVIVLARASAETTARLECFADRLASASSTRMRVIFLWDEALPADAADIERYVSELTSPNAAHHHAA